MKNEATCISRHDFSKDDLVVMAMALKPYERKQLAAQLILSTVGEMAAQDVADNVVFARDIINWNDSE